MKKITILFLLLIFSSMPSMAKSVSASKSPIEDEIVKSGFIKTKIHKKVKSSPITDELLDPKRYTNSPFRLGVFKNKYKDVPITDELIDENFTANASGMTIVKKETPDEYFIEKNIDVKKVRKIKPKTRYDFTKKPTAVRIRIADKLKSTKNLTEGENLPFIAMHDFVINGKKFDKGTTILGRIETISESDKMGVPECIKIDNFYINDNEEILLHGSVSKMGANRSIWVYPLYQAGNICFYVAGFVFVPIHGGKAKLSTDETFTVYYETP